MKLILSKEQYERLIPSKDSEIIEQDDATGGEGTTTYPAWETGIQRGPSNGIGVTKWSEVVQITRGKANPIP